MKSGLCGIIQMPIVWWAPGTYCIWCHNMNHACLTSFWSGMLWHLATWERKKKIHHNSQNYGKYTKLSWWKEPAVIEICLIYCVPVCVFDSPNEFSFPSIGRPIENVNNGVPAWMLLLIASCSTPGRLNMTRFMDLKVSNVHLRSGIATKSWNKSTHMPAGLLFAS